MAIIFLNRKQVEQVENFANSIDTSYYANRSQHDNEKRKTDQIIGKLGEVAVYEFLKSKYLDLTPPDFTIYDKSKKSWDVDLKSNKFNLHVKSQNFTQIKKFKESWTFQKSDKEIFEKKLTNQYVAFVIIDLQKKYADIKAIVSVNLLHELNLFKLPKLIKYQQDNKLVVYFEDLKKINEKELLQL